VAAWEHSPRNIEAKREGRGEEEEKGKKNRQKSRKVNSLNPGGQKTIPEKNLPRKETRDRWRDPARKKKEREKKL